MNILTELKKDLETMLHQKPENVFSSKHSTQLFPIMNARELNDYLIAKKTLNAEDFKIVSQNINGLIMRGVNAKATIPKNQLFLYSNDYRKGMLPYHVVDEYAISTDTTYYYTVDEMNANFLAFINDPIIESKANFKIIEKDDGIYYKSISTIQANKPCYVMYGVGYWRKHFSLCDDNSSSLYLHVSENYKSF